MEKVEELKGTLCNVRIAHRIIHDYQQRMLDLVRFIATKLDFGLCEGHKYFSDDITKKRNQNLNVHENMWAWDFLYSYVFEYYLGEMELDDGSTIAISIIQYSDTGYYDNTGNDRQNLETFAKEEDSISKLLFIIERVPKKKNWVWDIDKIVENKEYASKNHTKTVLEKNGCTQGLYSFPIERFIDEKSSIEALKEFLQFCKEDLDIELEIV